MAYTYSFFDNQIVGAAELNQWVRLFVSSGVADCFADGVPYSVSKLNDMVVNNCGSGIVPQTVDTLRVTVSGSMASIAPGVAFFEDGTTLEITETEQVVLQADAENYVYLKSVVEENRAYPAVSNEAPAGNVVLLAHIAADGTVEDLRKYAKGKVPSFYASDAGLTAYKKITLADTGELVLYRGNHDYRYLLIRAKMVIEDGHVMWKSNIFMDLKSGKAESNFLYVHSSNLTGKDYSCSESQNYEVVLYDHTVEHNYMRVAGAVHFTDADGTVKLILQKEGTAKDKNYHLGYTVFPCELEVYLF